MTDSMSLDFRSNAFEFSRSFTRLHTSGNDYEHEHRDAEHEHEEDTRPTNLNEFPERPLLTAQRITNTVLVLSETVLVIVIESRML